MATLMRQTLPEGVPVEMLDAVTKEMNVDNDPPPGMIVHVHYFDQGRARVVDVWESQDDYQRFRVAPHARDAKGRRAARNATRTAPGTGVPRTPRRSARPIAGRCCRRPVMTGHRRTSEWSLKRSGREGFAQAAGHLLEQPPDGSAANVRALHNGVIHTD